MINPFGVDVPLMEKQGLHKQKTESNLSQIQSHILRNDVGPFFKISFLFRFFSHVFAIANQLPHFSISRSADGKYFLTLFSGPFRHCSRMGGRSPFRKICYTYHTKKRLANYTLPKEEPKNIWITWQTPWVLLTSALFNQKSAKFAI